jgi:hypothetical protein
MKAARAAGYTAVRVEIAKDGTLVVVVGENDLSTDQVADDAEVIL